MDLSCALLTRCSYEVFKAVQILTSDARSTPSTLPGGSAVPPFCCGCVEGPNRLLEVDSPSSRPAAAATSELFLCACLAGMPCCRWHFGQCRSCVAGILGLCKETMGTTCGACKPECACNTHCDCIATIRIEVLRRCTRDLNTADARLRYSNKRCRVRLCKTVVQLCRH